MSKEWRQHLSGRGNERLWRALLFTKGFAHRYAPTLNAIRRLLSYSGNDVRQLAIDDVLRFRLTQPKLLAIVNGSKNLQFLTLKGSNEEELKIPEQPGFLNKLTHIVLDEFAAKKAHLLLPLMRNSAETLQHLHVTGLPRLQGEIWFPDMPNLKYLRLQGHDNVYPLSIEIVSRTASTLSTETNNPSFSSLARHQASNNFG